MTVRSKRISGREALVFIAALSHPKRDGSDDDIGDDDRW